jgi:hypothetical protein
MRELDSVRCVMELPSKTNSGTANGQLDVRRRERREKPLKMRDFWPAEDRAQVASDSPPLAAREGRRIAIAWRK